MLINPEDLKYCLEKAAWIQQQYRLHALPGDKMPPSVDELRRICTDEIGAHKIVIKRVPLDGNTKGIRSAYTWSENVVHIYILEQQDEPWNRYLIAKELFHMVVDKDEYRNMNIYKHLEEVSANWHGTAETSKSMANELMAEVAAMEFLFPYQNRIHERKTANPDFEALARHFKIPRIHVENYLSDYTIQLLAPFMLRAVQVGQAGPA